VEIRTGRRNNVTLIVFKAEIILPVPELHLAGIARAASGSFGRTKVRVYLVIQRRSGNALIGSQGETGTVVRHEIRGRVIANIAVALRLSLDLPGKPLAGLLHDMSQFVGEQSLAVPRSGLILGLREEYVAADCECPSIDFPRESARLLIAMHPHRREVPPKAALHQRARGWEHLFASATDGPPKLRLKFGRYTLGVSDSSALNALRLGFDFLRHFTVDQILRAHDQAVQAARYALRQVADSNDVSCYDGISGAVSFLFVDVSRSANRQFRLNPPLRIWIYRDAAEIMRQRG
jgi:hypothetical protein